MNRLSINGKIYPAYTTMGAMLQYKDLTGREINDEGTGISNMVVYMYCCVKSACKREGIPFDFTTAQDFADNVTPDDFNKWALAQGDTENGEKKTNE